MKAPKLFQLKYYSADQIRTLRFALGVSICFIAAVSINWPLAFLSPILLNSAINNRNRPMSIKAGIALLMIIFLAFFPFVLLGLIISRWPAIAGLILLLAFYNIFYLNALAKIPPLASTMLLVGTTVLPLMSMVQPALAPSFTVGFLFSALIAVIAAWMMFALIPDAKGLTYIDPPKKTSSLMKHEAQLQALASTVAIMPLALFFYGSLLIEDALVFAFVAILMQNPNIGGNIKAGIGLLVGNIFGGLIAYAIFIMLRGAPTLPFFAVLMFATTLIVGSQIFSQSKYASLFAGSFSTVLILLGSITSSSGGDFEAKFITRIIQISCAAAYVIASLVVLKGLFYQRALNYLERQKKASGQAVVTATR